MSSKRVGDIGRCLHWMREPFLSKEVEYLNTVYRDCLSLSLTDAFNKMISSTNESDYKRLKKNLRGCVTRGKKKKQPLKLLIPLTYFARLTRWFLPDVETVVLDDSYDSGQTVKDFNHTEKAVEFENSMAHIRVQFCPKCRENHLNVLDDFDKLSKPYLCASCKKVPEDHYLRYNLLPIWYERVPGATKHTQLKRDKDGNRVIRYDQPKQLTSLTMAEKLLIRRCAPYIPALHLHAGFMAMKGHAVAFEQDIKQMCVELPQRKETILTFIRQMGNKDTKAVHLKHLRVRRKKVLEALNWLKLHHVDYHDIEIKQVHLDWMNGKDSAYMRDKRVKISVSDKQPPRETQYVSRVQCLFSDDDEDTDYHILSQADGHHILTREQSEPIKELADSLDVTQKGKLMLFPPHGDSPVK